MQEELKQLIKRKDQIEGQIMGLDAEIKAIDQVKGFNKGLVDAQGFPRQDLDFGQLSNYRTLKKQKAMLNNDHYALMKQIQGKLHALHSSFPDISQQQEQSIDKKQEHKSPFAKKQIQMKKEQKQVQKQYQIDYLTPFGIISSVDQQAPAYKYGIRAGDLLSEFSQINVYSLDNIKEIPKHVKEGVKINVIVLRQEPIEQSQVKQENIYKLKDGKFYRKIKCQVIPQKWSGRGLLGCKIDPLK